MGDLLRIISGWFRPTREVGPSSRARRRREPLVSTFCRLEKRRVFAVDALFFGGALEIEISSLGQTQANLLADGSNFFVDNNNNQIYEVGEIRGAIADLQSVRVFSNALIGEFSWRGDFSLAPLAVPLGTGDVVRAEGVSEVHLQAAFTANGNISLNASDAIEFNSTIFVQGNLNATVSPSGSITDGANASIQVSGDIFLQSQNAIQLAEDGTSFWKVDGLTRVESQSDIELGLNGSWDSSTVQALGNNISLRDISSISIASINSLGNLSIDAIGAIEDPVGSFIDVGGSASLRGLNIVLSDSPGDLFHVSGPVSLTATGGSVLIGQPGSVEFGDISASGTSITLFEDAAMNLSSIQTTGSFSAFSSGSITDAVGASIQTRSMNLNAATFILLGDNLTDVVSVTQQAFLSAPNRIEIDSEGSVNLGSLGLVGGQAIVFEDSSTRLDGTQVGELQLHSRNSVTQSGIDTGAGTSVLQIAGPLQISLLGSPGNVDLYRASSNPPTLVSDGRLLDNRIDGLFTVEGIRGDLRLRNASGQAAIGLLEGSFDDVSIWHTQASIVLPNQDLQIDGNLELISGVDTNNIVSQSGNAIDRILNSNASINDSGTRLMVGGDARFVAASDITLGDVANETFRVATGSTSLISLGGGQISLGSAGAVLVSELGLHSKSIVDGHAGNVAVELDRSVRLVNPTMPNPDGREFQFAANDASIRLDGNLNDATGVQVVLGGNLVILATGDIQLVNDSSDSLSVAGLSDFRSTTGSIDLGRNGTLKLNDVNWNALQGSIAVGGQGRSEFGSIEARGVDVFIQEDTDMVVRAALAANRLTLASQSSIVNAVPFVTNGTLGISAKEIHIEAGTFAHLGTISVDQLTANVSANGSLFQSNLFALNGIADQTGQAYLNAVGQNLPPGISPVDGLISGETIDGLRSQASFVQSFGRNYGLFVQNDKPLNVGSINATGDGIHVLIETARGNDLIVSGTIHQRFTQTDPGGIVLIAGNQLLLEANAELRIEHVSQDVSTSRIVSQTQLLANAFDGGRGPFGFESTRDVLYASDAFADTKTQNVLQKVSTQFGVAGEAGFQTLIRYADGSSQLFDTNQELDASRQSNPSANTHAGVIAAHASSNGDAAVVERSTPFGDVFLGTFQTLPTSAIFRRSAEFFLFEQGGSIDASVKTVDLTSVVDPVADVLSPGRKISFQMPTEIVVTPAILVPPTTIASNTPTAYANLSTDIEPGVLSDATFEVFIVKVGFNDANRDGQPSDPELPTRDEVEVVAMLRKDAKDGGSEKEGPENAAVRAELAPGQPDSSTKETKGSSVPTGTEIEGWIEEYRDDPSKPSGAYAVISVDSVMGAKVLKVFGVRDFESPLGVPEFTPRDAPSLDNESVKETEEANPENRPVIQKEPIAMDKLSSAIEPFLHGDSEVVVAGMATGAFWPASHGTGHRFDRLARSLRGLQRAGVEAAANRLGKKS